MPATAKARVFMSGRSQHVTIPREFRFRSSTVSIRRDPQSGGVILSEEPSLKEVFAALDAAQFPKDFFDVRDREPLQERPELEKMFSDDSGERV